MFVLFYIFAIVDSRLVSLPSNEFFAGPAMNGDRIPLPTSWAVPTHTFVPGIVDHKNGYYTETHGNGKSVSWTNMPGMVGGAVCNNVGGCGSSLY